MTALCFALRPGGRLTLAGAREAMLNWLFARRHDGRFLVRLDDAGARGDAEAARALLEDLAWLGLGWDLFARRSERLALYAGAAEKLKAAGRLYPRAGDGLWCFRLERGTVTWEDLVRGPCALDTTALADPPLLAVDGTPLGVLAAVVDDIEHEVTHVLRGGEHLADTAIEIGVFRALGYAPPRVGHLPPPAGDVDLTVAELREAGLEPMAVNTLLAAPAAAAPPTPRIDLEALLFDFADAWLGAAPAAVDRAALDAANAGLLQRMPFDRVAHRLASGAGAAFWDWVCPGLTRFAEVEAWWRVCAGPLAPCVAAGDAAFLARAAELLPPDPLDDGSWEKWLSRLRALTERKGDAALAPLRLALTGCADGPPLAPLLPLIGRARAHARLMGESA